MEIIKYQFRDNDVRIVDVNGEPWFVAKDVCDVLGLLNPTEALKAIDGDDKSTLRISEGGPERNIINESGLYSLILRSNKPEARKFKKWVTSEVIPSIRKTGQYSITGDTRKLIAMALIEADKIIQEQTPKVVAYDAFMAADNVLSMAEVAAMFGLGRNSFMKMLRTSGVLKGDNTPYADYIHHFKVVVKPVTIGDVIENKTVTLFRPSGVAYVMKRFSLASGRASSEVT